MGGRPSDCLSPGRTTNLEHDQACSHHQAVTELKNLRPEACL